MLFMLLIYYLALQPGQECEGKSFHSILPAFGGAGREYQFRQSSSLVQQAANWFRVFDTHQIRCRHLKERLRPRFAPWVPQRTYY